MMSLVSIMQVMLSMQFPYYTAVNSDCFPLISAIYRVRDTYNQDTLKKRVFIYMVHTNYSLILRKSHLERFHHDPVTRITKAVQQTGEVAYY